MGTLIDMQQYKLHKQANQIATAVGSFFTMLFNFFLEYVAYPLVAAAATIRRRRVVVL